MIDRRRTLRWRHPQATCRRPVIAALALLFGFPATSIPERSAHAAWAFCGRMIDGAPATSNDEIEARRQALDAWLVEAGRLGVAYTRWQLAFDRRLACTRTPDGAHTCRAHGRPCRISQVPPPPDAEWLRRGPPP